jgi:hypothetical protein
LEQRPDVFGLKLCTDDARPKEMIVRNSKTASALAAFLALAAGLLFSDASEAQQYWRSLQVLCLSARVRYPLQRQETGPGNGELQNMRMAVPRLKASVVRQVPYSAAGGWL